VTAFAFDLGMGAILGACLTAAAFVGALHLDGLRGWR
jgi:hypothetical protein